MYIINGPQMRVAIAALQSGSTRQRISRTNLAGIHVPVPPLAEQRRIVAEIEKQLTRLDAALDALRQVNASLKRFRASATEAAFASCSVARTRHLGSLGEIVGGLTKGQKRKVGTRTRPVPYLRVANVQRGRLDLNNIKLIEATEEEIRGLSLMPGDVLLNEGGDRDKLGRGWVWEGQIAGCIHQNHVFRVRLDPGLATPRFVSHYANHFGQKYFFREGKQTTNLASINMTKLRALPVPLPPVSEQEELIATLEDQLSMVANLDSSVDANLRRAACLRQAILKKAFEGKLAPQDPHDEPASVLLARIRSTRPHSGTRTHALR
jgi:type I restriction enzyme S subunit